MHRALAGEGPFPDAWKVSRACEEFGYTVSQALREYEECPVGYIESLIEMRTYARAYAQYQAVNGDMSKLSSSSLMQLVREIDIDVSKQLVDEAEVGEGA